MLFVLSNHAQQTLCSPLKTIVSRPGYSSASRVLLNSSRMPSDFTPSIKYVQPGVPPLEFGAFESVAHDPVTVQVTGNDPPETDPSEIDDAGAVPSVHLTGDVFTPVKEFGALNEEQLPVASQTLAATLCAPRCNPERIPRHAPGRDYGIRRVDRHTAVGIIRSEINTSRGR